MTKLVRIRIDDSLPPSRYRVGGVFIVEAGDDAAMGRALRTVLVCSHPRGVARLKAIVAADDELELEGARGVVFAEPGMSVGLQEMADAECVIGVMPDGTGRVLKNREGPEGHTISAKAVAWLRANPGGRLTGYAPPAPPGNGPA